MATPNGEETLTSASYGPSGGGGQAAPEGTSPSQEMDLLEQRLRELRRKLRSRREDVKAKQGVRDRQDQELSAARARLEKTQADKTALEGVVNEIEKIVAAYAIALSGFQQRRTEAEDYKSSKERMVEGEIRDYKTKIVKIVTDYDSAVGSAESSVFTAEDKVVIKKRNYEDKKKTFDQSSKAFTVLKVIEKDTADRLKKITDIRTTIEKEEERRDGPENFKFGIMYYLLQHVQTEINKVVLDKRDDLKTKIVDAWLDMNKAQDDFRTAEIEQKQSEDELKAAQETLKQLNDNRDKTIRRDINELRLNGQQS